MSRVKYDVLARTGTYTNAGGEEKSRWMKSGVVFENEKGYLSLKLEGIPVGPDWSGWVSLFAAAMLFVYSVPSVPNPSAPTLPVFSHSLAPRIPWLCAYPSISSFLCGLASL